MLVVVGGWVPGRGPRLGVAALLVGRPAAVVEPGAMWLEFVGVVRSGWTVANSPYLQQRLRRFARPNRPFRAALPSQHTRHAIWVAPAIVGDVTVPPASGAREWLDGLDWVGIRTDQQLDDLIGR